MYLSKRVKVVAGVSALLGVVMAGGVAFTGAGLTDSAGTLQFVGGTVIQNDAGTTLNEIAYTYANPTPGAGASSDTEVEGVTLTFADDNAAGLVPTISFTGTDGGSDAAYEYLTADWTCTAIASSASTCAVANPSALYSGQGYALDVTSITVTVPPVQPGI
jgi:hypothetical protein